MTRKDELNWVVFDGDNTLWHVETLYDPARDSLAGFITSLRKERRFDEIVAYQRADDHKLFSTLGYSSDRFPTSFANTLTNFIADVSDSQMSNARKLGSSVFEEHAHVDWVTAVVLAELKKTFRFALFTAGEQWVQQRRLESFEFSSQFDLIK